MPLPGGRGRWALPPEPVHALPNVSGVAKRCRGIRFDFLKEQNSVKESNGDHERGIGLDGAESKGATGDVSNGPQEPWKEQGTPKPLRAGQPQGEAEGL